MNVTEKLNNIASKQKDLFEFFNGEVSTSHPKFQKNVDRIVKVVEKFEELSSQMTEEEMNANQVLFHEVEVNVSKLQDIYEMM
jgi:hypothetical protein